MTTSIRKTADTAARAFSLLSAAIVLAGTLAMTGLVPVRAHDVPDAASTQIDLVYV